MSLPHRIAIRVTEAEYRRWLLVSDGVPLAPWARVVVNAHVREVLGSFGEGEGTVVAAPVPTPSPEEPVNVIERIATGESFTTSPEEISASVQEFEEAFGPLSDRTDELGLEENCPQASQHWQIPRGNTCPTCGGVAR